MEAGLSPPLLWHLQLCTSIQYQTQLSPGSFWEPSAPCDLCLPSFQGESSEPLTLWPHLSICGPAACCIYGAHHSVVVACASAGQAVGSLGGTTTTLSCLLPSPKDKTSMSLQCLARTSSSGHLAFKGPNCDLLELFHVGGTQS